MPRHRLVAVLLGLALSAACGSPASRATIPDVSLPKLSGGEKVSLASCPTAKCLTVYLAPWCGYCRASTPMIKRLAEFLAGHEIATRIVVGKDSRRPVEGYAREFGPETLLDLEDAVPVGGVPYFVVSGPDGRVIRDVSGVPMGVTDVAEFAAVFGLP